MAGEDFLNTEHNYPYSAKTWNIAKLFTPLFQTLTVLNFDIASIFFFYFKNSSTSFPAHRLQHFLKLTLK